MRWRERRRGVAILLAAGLAAVALVAVLAIVALAAPRLAFIHIRTNLSQTATRVSAYPDLAVSPNGDRVVAAWTEGYATGVGYKGNVYLRVASETGGGWGGKITVFSGDSLACAYDAAVAVTGTTAHVAYVVFRDTCNIPTQIEVHYKTCSLTSGQCDSSEHTVASVNTSVNKITWVDLAVDADGDPHVVWAQYDAGGGNGEILYSAYDGSSWSDAYTVASNENNKKNNNAPAIAWADGYAHVVWEEQDNHQIWYRRRGTSWDAPVALCTPQTLFPPGNPDVAAGTGRVFVVWDWCSDINTNPPCWKYNLVYKRSNDRGSSSSWGDILEVGTDDLSFSEEYDSVDDETQRDEYLLNLQPSIALNDDGWPTVVWHADRSGGAGTDYAIYYSYALTGTATSVNWVITPTVLSQGQPTMLGSAVIGVGEPGGEQHRHVAYMQRVSASAWDVYYDSDEWDRYSHLYLPLTMRN